MTHDRMQSNEILLTQEFLAMSNTQHPFCQSVIMIWRYATRIRTVAASVAVAVVQGEA